MVTTYRAILRAGRLDWGTDGPPPSISQLTVPVELTVDVPSMPASARGTAMAAALAKIADAGGPSGYGDPIAWQDDSRKDRLMPGREE